MVLGNSLSAEILLFYDSFNFYSFIGRQVVFQTEAALNVLSGLVLGNKPFSSICASFERHLVLSLAASQTKPAPKSDKQVGYQTGLHARLKLRMQKRKQRRNKRVKKRGAVS